MNQKTISLFLIFLVGLLAMLQSPVAAQDTGPTATPHSPAATPSDDEVNAVAKQMYCPVCENIPLDVCPTTACQEWRELIRQKLAAGWSEQQIKDYFAAQYGDRVLSEPPRRGLNWLVYVLPVVFFLFGVVILWNVVRPKNRAAVTASTAAQQPSQPKKADDPYLAKLEEELRKK